MREQLQHFGTPCELPSDKIVGTCHVCSGDIYAHELAEENCDCSPDDKIHEGCKIPCAACGREGCKSCLEKDDETGEYLCDEDDCRTILELKIEKEEWEELLRYFENLKEGINKEIALAGREIDEINRKLKEYG